MKDKRKELEWNIRKFYLYKILGGMFFIIPIVVLFWQEKGLSLTEIMILQSVFSIAVVLLEIPSGYFSDIFGRKKSLIIASIGSVLGIIAYSLGSNFWEFLVAELFFAIALSFESGTLSAFLFETLKELKREDEYKKIYGQAIFYGTLAIAFANILGAFVAKYDLRYAFYLNIPFFVLMIPIAFSLYEPKKVKEVAKENYFKTIFLTLKNEVYKNEKLRWIIIYSAVIYSFNGAALWLYQPYFKISGLDIIYFGIVFASFQVVAAFSSKYAHKIEEKLGQRYSLLMLGFLVAMSYLLMSNFIFLFSFSFAFIQQFVRGFRFVVVSDYINKMIQKDEMRATILSVESLVGRLIYSISIPFIGWLADVYTLENALTMVGIVVLFLTFVFLWIFRKMRVF